MDLDAERKQRHASRTASHRPSSCGCCGCPTRRTAGKRGLAVLHLFGTVGRRRAGACAVRISDVDEAALPTTASCGRATPTSAPPPSTPTSRPKRREDGIGRRRPSGLGRRGCDAHIVCTARTVCAECHAAVMDRLVIRSAQESNFSRRERVQQRWRRWYARIYEEPRADDGHLLRLARRRAAARHARRSPFVLAEAAWTLDALRENRQMLKQLFKRSASGERDVRLEQLRWTRGPNGVKLLEDGGVTYQTLANDLRAVAVALDERARRDRGDRDRHD